MSELSVLVFTGAESMPDSRILDYLGSEQYRLSYSEPTDGGYFEDINRTIRKARGDALQVLQRDEKCVFLGFGTGVLTAMLLGAELPVDGVVCCFPVLKPKQKKPLLFGQNLQGRHYSGQQIRRLYVAAWRTELALRDLRCPLLVLTDAKDPFVSSANIRVLKQETEQLTEKEIHMLQPGEHPEKMILEFLQKIKGYDPIR